MALDRARVREPQAGLGQGMLNLVRFGKVTCPGNTPKYGYFLSDH